MIKPSKAVIAGAAIAGLMTGSLAVRSYAASVQGKAGTPAQTLDDAQKGKHSCKGKGGCATDGTPMPKAA